MKSCLPLLLLLFNLYSFSQKSEVENGLVLQKTISEGQKPNTKFIYDRMKEGSVHGVSVAVVNDGQIEWSEAYGMANATDSVTTNTKFQCASIGKIITAMAVLNLVKEGKLKLDDNVNDKLIRWKVQENELTLGNPVTIRKILSHQAGFIDQYGFMGYRPDQELPNPLQVLNGEKPATKVKTMEVKYSPGTKEKYSGGGYLILQVLIEDVTGKDFSAFVNEVVFKPLSMTNTSYDNIPTAPYALGYSTKGKPLKGGFHIYPEKAPTGPWTTAEDLAKLIIEIQKAYIGRSEKVLNKDLCEEFLTPQINRKGLGPNLRGLNEPLAFWHAGQNEGYLALWYGLIEQEKGAVVLTNSDSDFNFPQEFITSVADVYRWPIMRNVFVESPSESDLLTLPGTYVNDEKQKRLNILIKDEKIHLTQGDSKKGYDLLKIGDNHFTFKDSQDYFKLSFEKGANNEIIMHYTESIGLSLDLVK